MFLKLLILSILLVAVALLGLAVRIMFVRGGRFPETHIGRNKEMAKRGIRCAQSIDVGCNPTDDFPGCSSCGGIK
ncbi:MAG: hypothetical protein JW965_00925 [Bacteroidales bacterium]|nr:hypothetical protein [Bacteroidales bacterium]